ncbi:MAG: hypothetical protein HY938_00270 [Nitrosomonadales bacterium]|nr:hypothetical protein [Nitrosomonadales bacterium]
MSRLIAAMGAIVERGFAPISSGMVAVSGAQFSCVPLPAKLAKYRRHFVIMAGIYHS